MQKERKTQYTSSVPKAQGKPVALEYLDGTIRHLRNSLAKQRDALPKGMRNTIGVLVSMWGRETLGGGNSIAPGMAAIAKRAGVSERMARAHYRALVNWGFIVPLREGRGRGRVTVFALDIGALVRALMTMKYRISKGLISKLRDIADAANLPKIARNKTAVKPEISEREKPEVKPEILSAPYIDDINTVRSEGCFVQKPRFNSARPVLGKIGASLLAGIYPKSIDQSRPGHCDILAANKISGFRAGPSNFSITARASA